MAQTIALQRGTATVLSNGSSITTLFTQSGGTATRVIMNQLIFTSSNEWGNGYLSDKGIGIYHESSGGKTSLLGIIRDNVDNMKEWQFPVAHNTFNFWQPLSTSTLTGASPIIFTDAGGGIVATTPPTTRIYYTGNTSQIRYSAMPPQFYIGPGDSIKVKAQGRDSGSQPTTVTVGYSFTTITEA